MHDFAQYGFAGVGESMIQDVMIDPQRWRDVFTWYRGAPHQEAAILKLYQHLKEVDPCLLSVNSEWFSDYQQRDKLLHTFMHPDGE